MPILWGLTHRPAFATSLHPAPCSPGARGFAPFPAVRPAAARGPLATQAKTSRIDERSPDERTDKPPSARQMRYLRSLAEQRGESFAYPRTGAEASAEIQRLKSRKRDTPTERRLEREQVGREMAARGDASGTTRLGDRRLRISARRR